MDEYSEFPYYARIDYSNLQQTVNEPLIWLVENIGLAGQRYMVNFQAAEVYIRFVEEKDLVWFRLRWGV